jgi:hypothetical protein
MACWKAKSWLFPAKGIDILVKQKGCFYWALSRNFTQLLLNVIKSASSANGQVVSWIRHDVAVRLVDGTMSSPLSWLHRMTRSDVLSDVSWVSGRDDVRWSQVWAVLWVFQDCETKAVNLCSRSWARVRPRIVVSEENLLHNRTNCSNMCLRLRSCNAVLKFSGGATGH